jgi:muconate cycloisomerase
VAPRFAEAGVNVLEQPLAADQRHLMAQLRAATTLPLALDEATVGPADAFHYIAQGMVDYFVIKVTRSGGLWPTVQQIAIAESAGLPLLVSGLTESLLAKVAACQVAAAHGFAGPAALNGTQFLDPKAELALFPDKPSIEHDGAVHLTDTPGLGLRPDVAAIQRYLHNTE